MANCNLFAQAALYMQDNVAMTIESSGLLYVSGNIEASDSGDSALVTNLGTIEITGNWNNNGSGGLMAIRNGEVRFNGSSSQQISGTTLFNELRIDNSTGVTVVSGTNHVFHTLYLDNGAFVTNDSLYLHSDTIRTARIDEITSGSISGDVIVEQWMDSTGYNYRFMTAPVQGATLSDWLDDFTMTGFTGSQFPGFSFNSVFFYDETSFGDQNTGYYNATNITNSVTVGMGIQVYTGGDQFVADVKGAPWTGNQDLPVTFTDDPGQDLTQDGWNLVANPYPSVIDWDDLDWDKSSMDDAIYIYDGQSGQYMSYIAGVGINGGSRYIASSQSFFVKANATSPILRAKEGVKSAQNVNFTEAKAGSELLRLAISDGINFDETVVRIHPQASKMYDGKFDAFKFHTTEPLPSISTTWDSLDYSILSFSDESPIDTIPLKITVPSSGFYQIQVSEVPNSSMHCAWLYDTFTGRKESLRDSSVFHFYLYDTTSIARFQIISSSVVDYSITHASCFGESGALLANPIHLNNTVIDWVDTYSGLTGSDTLNATSSISLKAGIYHITIDQASCLQQKDTLSIYEPLPIFSQPFSTPDTGFNSGKAWVKVSGGTSPYEYVWNDPLMQSMDTASALTPGSYQVMIIDSLGCTDSAMIEVNGILVGLKESGELTEQEISIYPNPVSEYVTIKVNHIPSEISIKIYNINGQIVFQSALLNPVSRLDLGNLKTGHYYLHYSSEKMNGIMKFQKVNQ